MDAIRQIHQSVLLDEVVEILSPSQGGIYVDGNLGLGGHSERILELSAPDGQVVGFEWNQPTLELAKERLERFGTRVHYVRDSFAALGQHLQELGIARVDGILLDLGVSSYQLDVSEDGFSYRGSQPLDMRMDDRLGSTAADIINEASEEELADIFYYYGEERQARRIAAFVVQQRSKERFSRTDQLVDLINRAVPKRFQPDRIHPATKVFQALRIAVNRELDQLQAILEQGADFLNSGGRFCVIAFHSLEDRMVKTAFRESSTLKSITKKPIVPTAAEIAINPRSRSAKLRAAAKVSNDDT